MSKWDSYVAFHKAVLQRKDMVGSPAWPKNPANLGKKRDWFLNMFRHLVRHHEIERLVGKWPGVHRRYKTNAFGPRYIWAIESERANRFVEKTFLLLETCIEHIQTI